jgi:hypothetical protein
MLNENNNNFFEFSPIYQSHQRNFFADAEERLMSHGINVNTLQGMLLVLYNALNLV